jgi:cytochrome oxidase Cu insertion factor (SCO1/SenC/PrrC family)
MDTNNELNKEQQKKGRVIFLLMAVFFTVPLLIVIAMYKLDWRPAGTSYGELVVPAIRIPNYTELKDNLGKPQGLPWQDKWNLVVVTDTCESVCLEKLHDIRQIHVSMYKDIMRVRRVLVTRQTDVNAIQQKYPDLIILNQNEQTVSSLTQQFVAANNHATAKDKIFLVDPLGHIMMRYKPTTQSNYIRKDLVRLLRSSWAG